MPSSPISDPPSPPNAAAEDAADNNLQPFFVLHKALPRNPSKKAPGSGKARRKIDLSPKSVEKSYAAVPSETSDAIYERLRLNAFDLTWSKIDTTIKEALRQINFNLFDEVHGWVRESFSAISSTGGHHASEMEWPYPLVTNTIWKQIPTALTLTRNAEFADDLLTFQELRGHLRSNGCHVANLSALDFSIKHGLGGCLRVLLRQLIMDAPDVADIAVLASWYHEPVNYDKPIVVIIDDMERCSSVVLAEFIIMLSEWVIKLPIIFVMGVTTTVDALRRMLPSDALQHLQACKFTLGSPSERMNAIIEAVLVRPCSGFNISHKVALFLCNYFLRHDGTVTSFIRALKLSCIKHFTEESLSFLGHGVLDEDNKAFWHGKCEALPDNLRRYAFDLPSCRSKGYAKETFNEGTDCTGVNLAQGLSELRRLQKNWSSVVMCLFEVGKLHKMQLLDIFCEAVDPALCSLRASDHNLMIASLNEHNMIEGSSGYAKGGFISQAIDKVRELPVASVFNLLSLWSSHTKELTEIHERVRELQSLIGTADGGNIWKEALTDFHKRSVYLRSGMGIISVSDKAAVLLDVMVREFLMPLECIPFHEIVCFKHVDILQSALLGDPRRTIQVDLLKSHSHLQCSCCGGDENVLSPSMHDTSILYILAQEYGDLINLHDWYQSFKARILSLSTKTKRKTLHSPASKKAKSTSPEGVATIQARFCRAVMELQITGLLRMPSKRRPDFVQRVAFGL